jgi:hypothetical protein
MTAFHRSQTFEEPARRVSSQNLSVRFRAGNLPDGFRPIADVPGSDRLAV